MSHIWSFLLVLRFSFPGRSLKVLNAIPLASPHSQLKTAFILSVWNSYIFKSLGRPHDNGYHEWTIEFRTLYKTTIVIMTMNKFCWHTNCTINSALISLINRMFTCHLITCQGASCLTIFSDNEILFFFRYLLDTVWYKSMIKQIQGLDIIFIS